MFIIKMICYDANLKIQPYVDYVSKFFEEKEDAEAAVFQCVNDEVESLNSGDAEGEFIATFEDESHYAVVNFWEGEDCEGNRDYRPVTIYDILEMPEQTFFKAKNIQWDTDGEDPKELGLPDEIEIPEELFGDEDGISDYLSDETGFCHKGFTVGIGIRLWARIGVTMEVTMEDYIGLQNDDESEKQDIMYRLLDEGPKKGKVELNGETYFPDIPQNGLLAGVDFLF